MSADDARSGLRGNGALELLATNLPGAFTSPAPPTGFDLLSASPAALANYGIFWRRPGPDGDPRVRAVWESAARRGWRSEDRIQPHLEPLPGVSHRLRGARQRDDGTYTSDNWSGASLAASRGRRWSGAVGHWAVPALSGSPDARAGWKAAAWVGLDGLYGTRDGLQAGVEERLDAEGNASYGAWYEWYVPEQRDSPLYIWHTDIPNFAVRAGDVVYCSAQYLATRAGHLIFANETTGEHFSLTLRPPPGASFAGEGAEWIMETPDFGEGPTLHPAVDPVQFEGAVCCGADAGSGDPVDGDTWVVQGFGITMTEVAVASGSVTVALVG
jgi:hypothetical protein